jgi:hypothetical protein
MYVSLGAGSTPAQHWALLPSPAHVTSGGDPYARVNPFNPCKPLWSSICHLHWPFGYYGKDEDWAAPTQDQVVAGGGPLPGTLPGDTIVP